MKKNINSVISKTVLLLALTASAVLKPSVAGQFNNVVIGQGCASTCVNGKCEKVCRGSDADVNAQQQNNKEAVLSEKNFHLDGFESLSIDSVDVYARHSEHFAVSASGDSTCVDSLNLAIISDSPQSKKTLKASMKNGCAGQVGVKVVVSMPVLSMLDAHGNSDVIVQGFNQKALDVQVYDNVNVNLEQNRVEMFSLSSSGNSTVESADNEFFKVDVAITDQSDVTLSFGRSNKGYLTGIVAGMSDLLYCGATAQSLTITELADANQIDCDLSKSN